MSQRASIEAQSVDGAASTAYRAPATSLDFERVSRLVNIGVWSLDSDGKTVWLSEVMRDLLNDAPETLPLDDFLARFSEEERAELREAFDDAIAGESSLDVEASVPNGGPDPCWLRLISEDDAGLSGVVVGCAQDVTDEVVTRDDMTLLATRDYLTEVNNRANFTKLFQMLLDQTNYENERLVLMLIDIDHFKSVNDSFGHDVGDSLLREVSAVLTRAVRDRDVVGRLGGDEFGLVARSPRSIDLGTVLSERILTLADESDVLKRIGGGVTLSIGVAEMGPEVTKVKAALKAADLALYEAKRSGRNQAALYRAALGQEHERREQTLSAVEEALQLGQITPHYQAKICLRTGAIRGVEALARWRHPERGLLTPGSFAEALDDMRLSTKISDAVLEQAVRDIALATEQGVGFGSVAVNVTEKQIANRGFLDQLDGLLVKHEVKANLIAVEITEAVLLARNARAIRDNLIELHQRGVAIGLDDFGTGYASLTHLRSFTLDHLKIDKSFIFDLDKNHESRVITHAVIRMAHDLGMTVVAEGVENAEATKILQSYGCDSAQGLYYSRPVAFEELLDFARARSLSKLRSIR